MPPLGIRLWITEQLVCRLYLETVRRTSLARGQANKKSENIYNQFKTQAMRQIFLLLLSFNVFLVYGQNCDCPKEFDFLVKKIENDYAGFKDKVNSKTINDYNEHTEKIKSQTEQIRSFQRCTMVLESWLRFFNDKHLSIEIDKNIYFTYKRINSEAVLLRIPEFSWNYKDLIDSLILTNKSEITSTPILIIDLRGNGGGTDYCFQELLPLIYTNPYIKEGAEYWASQGNIDLFEKALKEGTIKKGREKETEAFVDSLKKYKNSFYQPPNFKTITSDTIYKTPQMVSVIIDDYCASSCEEFILSAKNSAKTTIFGTQTLGVLDYSNSDSEDLLTKGFRIRYPMTRSTRLPEFPIDNIGIKPDVEINLPVNLNVKSDIDDWVLFVYDYFKKVNKQSNVSS